MKVLKFGGSSIEDPQAIEHVLEILEHQPPQTVVVFSALGGVTNLLESSVALASKGDSGYHQLLAEIESKHISIGKALINPKSFGETYANIKQLFNELTDKLESIKQIGEATPRAHDLILSYGERFSLELIKGIAQQRIKGISSLDARELIITHKIAGVEIVEQSETNKRIKEKLKDVKGIALISGFISRSVDGYPTTLGRGGSDLTAALLASALNVRELEMWTNVSGIYTANPTIIPTAYPISHLSYAEALELGHFGAKVIYPPSIQPVFAKGISVVVKNTFAKDESGTIISPSPALNGDVVRAISSIDNIGLLSLYGSGMVGVTGIASRMFAALARENINVILITQASSEHSICVAVDEKQLIRASKAIADEFEYEIATDRVQPVEVEREFSIIAVVGERLKQTIGISGQVFSALGRNGVNIHAIAQGASEFNISAVVKSTDRTKAINAIHQEFFHRVLKTANLFIVGVGNVGSALLTQLSSQIEHLEKEHNLSIRIVGAANSKSMIFNPEGINFENYINQLKCSKTRMEIETYTRKMFSLNLANSIFIDVTSSQEINDQYDKILAKSISVVACNKIAASSAYEHYIKLRKLAKSQGVHFKYETNVGAGLPVLQTISNLVKSGDKVFGIDAVVSGSFNFILNQIEKGATFSQAVVKAMENGYTEPNPLIDLKGDDVTRKLIILAREAGYPIEESDVELMPYLPHPLPDKFHKESFIEKLTKYDKYFLELFAESKSKGQKLRLVAKLNNSRATIALEAVGVDSPLYELQGNDNIISLTTARYNPNPLVIRGAGAGADVTAAGIFADILSILNN